jgi:hypothetical protein
LVRGAAGEIAEHRRQGVRNGADDLRITRTTFCKSSATRLAELPMTTPTSSKPIPHNPIDMVALPTL